MAETNTAPSPNFSTIDFNPSFFTTSTALTIDEADALYLNKSTPDTANVLETFTVGISANAIQATTASISSSLQVSGTFTSDSVDSVGGTLTLGPTNATSIVASKNITLNSTSLSTVGQLGYTNTISISPTTTSATANTVTNLASTSIPAGTYLVHFSGSGSFAGVYNIGINTSATAFDPKYTIGASTVNAFNQNYTKPSMTVIIQNSATTTWYLNHSSTSASYTASRIYWYYTRIA